MPRIGCVAWQNRSQKGKFVEIISPAKGYFRETYKAQNIKNSEYDQEIPQSQTADNSPWVSYRSKLKAYQLVFSG